MVIPFEELRVHGSVFVQDIYAGDLRFHLADAGDSTIPLPAQGNDFALLARGGGEKELVIFAALQRKLPAGALTGGDQFL